MDDFPHDELDDASFHITPSSSVLAALSSLNPPSPILTPSQLTFTWSSGDIPVVLFDDAYAIDGRALTVTPTTIVSVRNTDSCASPNDAGIRRLDYKRTSHSNSRFESQSDIESFQASGSSNTLASVGTFGPRRANLKLCEETRLSTGTCFPEISSPTSGMDYERRGPISTRHHSRRSSGKTLPDTVALVALTSQASSETVKALAPGICLSGNDKPTAPSSLRTGLGDIGTYKSRAYELPKIPETPNKIASDRTATWIHSQEWSSPQRQDYGFPEIVSLFNEASTEQQPLTSPFTPARRLDTHFVAASSQPPSLSRVHREHQRHKSSHQVDASHPKHLRQPKEDFAWLNDITVQVLVDQEGFRTAQPSFKLSGIVHLRSSLEPQTPSPAMAQFRPITRQSFHFHYAAFETPPVLRRVTTSDQETHDYVSRQAHLTLKCNGVYVVHGHEISCAEHDGQAQKLSWQFEYLVDDRRIEVSGRVIEGEKILTPLTFSCSPELLLPAQGKRINIMHVFKKGVAPKLSAEKLQPPGTPESPGALSPSKTDTRVSHSVFGGKSHGWSLHRRVQSHGTRQQDGHKTANSRARIHSGTHGHRTRIAAESAKEDEFSRHRRASSVGNHSQTASYSSTILHNRRHDSPTKATAPSTMPHPSRHIIPPSRLAELFDSTTDEFYQPVPASVHEPSAFTSLTPRPRSRHAWS